MTTPQEYLAPGFDPSILRVPQLRSILLQHGKSLPSTARKPALIEAFNQHVAPLAADLRKQQQNIVASSSGIIDMRSKGHADSDTTDLSNKPKPSTNRKASASMPNQSATSARSRKSIAQPTTLQSSAVSQSDQDEPKPRRTRKSILTKDQQQQQSPPREVTFSQLIPPPTNDRRAKRLSRGTVQEENAFSDHNPFQSGGESSPSVGPAAKAAASVRKARRKTYERSSPQVASILTSPTDHDVHDDHHVHDDHSDEPDSPSPSLKNYMDSSVAATTTPRIIGKTWSKDTPSTDNAQSEEENDADNDDDDDVQNPNQLHSPSALAQTRMQQIVTKKRYAHQDLSTSQKLSQVLWTTLFFAFVAWSLWYSSESNALGYCDTDSDTNSIILQRHAQALAEAKAAASSNSQDPLSNLPILPQSLRPTCAPCPLNAQCQHGKLMGCVSKEYVLQPHWLETIPYASKLLPLNWISPSCVPDTRTLVLASELSAAVNQFLARWKGDVICAYEKPHPSTSKLDKQASKSYRDYAMPEKVIKKAMFDSRDAEQINQVEFEELWVLAMDDLKHPASNVVRLPVASFNNQTTLAQGEPTDFLAANVPILTITCRSSLAFQAWLKKTRIYFFLFCSALGTVAYSKRSWRLAREEKKKVVELVQVALERLQEQEYSHAVDSVLNPDPFVPTSHLRDHVLRSEHSTKARQRLWKKVAKVVEENANVRTRQAMKRGEWLRVWEWVGVVGAGMSSNVPFSSPSSPSPSSPAAVRSAGRHNYAMKRTSAVDMEMSEPELYPYTLSSPPPSTSPLKR